MTAVCPVLLSKRAPILAAAHTSSMVPDGNVSGVLVKFEIRTELYYDRDDPPAPSAGEGTVEVRSRLRRGGPIQSRAGICRPQLTLPITNCHGGLDGLGFGDVIWPAEALRAGVCCTTPRPNGPPSART